MRLFVTLSLKILKNSWLKVLEDRVLNCPHCNVVFNAYWHLAYIGNSKDNDEMGSQIVYVTCPTCDQVIINIQYGITNKGKAYGERELKAIQASVPIYPLSQNVNIANEVPSNYKQDLEEAVSVLELSPKSSAALSRRLLQKILREKLNVKKQSLAKEIEEILSRGEIPTYIKESIDAVRNVGNFAAHPSKSKNTGEIVEVEPNEAEWLIEVIDALFDHVFVQPEKLKLRKEKLNSKLAEIGKPPMKDASDIT